MIGLYGCAGLAILCILVVGSRLMASTSSFLATSFCRRHGHAMAKSLFFLGTDDLGRDVLSRLFSGAAPTVAVRLSSPLPPRCVAYCLAWLPGQHTVCRSAVLNHILDTLLSIPSLLLAIIVVAWV